MPLLKCEGRRLCISRAVIISAIVFSCDCPALRQRCTTDERRPQTCDVAMMTCENRPYGLVKKAVLVKIGHNFVLPMDKYFTTTRPNR